MSTLVDNKSTKKNKFVEEKKNKNLATWGKLKYTADP